MKTAAPIIRILFGCLFIASGIVKLFPIDAFELILIKQVGVSWDIAPLFTRLVIILEIVLGLFISFGFFTRLMVIGSIAMLIGFSIFLANQIMSGSGAENCGCFGELIPMDAPESLAKNLVFMAIALFLMGANKHLNRWSLKWVPIPLVVIGIPILLYFVPLPEADLSKEATINSALISEVNESYKADFLEGDKVLVLLFSKCVHCKQLASLIATTEDPSKIRLIIYGGERGAKDFVADNGVSHIPFYIGQSRNLLRAFNGKFPTVVYVRDGEVVSNWTGKEVNKELLTQLLNQ